MGLPGAKKKKTTPPNTKDNECAVCHLLFSPRENETFDRQYKVQNKPMGCMAENCSCWIHVRCSKFKIKAMKDIEKLECWCPIHVGTVEI